MSSAPVKLTPVATSAAPSAIGPYSQAIKAGPFVFLSGVIPVHAETGEVTEGGIEEQTKLVLSNMKSVLQAAGSSPDQVVKTSCFLKDMNDFAKFNAAYAEFFGTHKPARSTVEVARLPKDVLVEIECIAAYA